MCMSEGEREWEGEREREKEREAPGFSAFGLLNWWQWERYCRDTVCVYFAQHLLSSPVQLHQWTVTNGELVHQSDAHRRSEVI